MTKSEEKLDALTSAVQQLVNTPVLPIAPVHPGDHDLLISLNEKMIGLKNDIQDLRTNSTSDVTATRTELLAHITEDNKMHNAHEVQIRAIEIDLSVLKTKFLTWGAAALLALGVAEFVINKAF